MGMSGQIIVGYDGTGHSSDAVMWAAHEAVCRQAPMRIVCCYDIPIDGEAGFGWASAESINGLLEATEIRLEEVRGSAVSSHPTVKVMTVTSAGPPLLALLDSVTSDDLVVLGASTHQGRAAFWLGSTPRLVIRHSPCPVVVVHGAVGRGRPDRIVVGVDGSPASDLAVQWASGEAALHQAPLVVVHGWWYPYMLVENSRSQARDLTRVDAACVLDRSVELARQLCGADVIGTLVESGPASALLDTACDGDLLVVGSRGHGAIRSGLIGSTAISVIERSSTPVAVIRVQ